MDAFISKLRALIPHGRISKNLLREVLQSVDPSLGKDESLQSVYATIPDPVSIEHLASFLFEDVAKFESKTSRSALYSSTHEICTELLEDPQELVQERQKLNYDFPLLRSAGLVANQQRDILLELDANFAGAVAALQSEKVKPGGTAAFLAHHFAGLAGFAGPSLTEQQDEDAFAARRSPLPGTEASKVYDAAISTASQMAEAIVSGSYVDLPELRKLLEADVALVKASYILELAATGTKMPRRQDVPDSAFVSPRMLDRIFKELEALNEKRSHAMLEMHFPGLVIVSYAWQAKEHPDGDGHMLNQVLAPAIEWYMSERAAYIKRKGFDGMGGVANIEFRGWSKVVDQCGLDQLEAVDFAVFVDYVSMYQKPRDPEQNAVFQRALNKMDLLYAHQLTVKFRLTWTLPGARGLPYGSRGWPFFETAVSAMISGSWHVLDLGLIDWTEPVEYFRRRWNGRDSEDFGKPVHVKYDGKMQPFETLVEQASYHYRNETVGIVALLKKGRRPPLLPQAFATEVSSKTFTNDADVESVIRMHTRVCTEVLADVEVLSYNELGWGPFEAHNLAQVVLACPKLKGLDLYKNPWGDRGVAALATALSAGSLDELRVLSFDITQVGDRGAIGIANLIKSGKLPKLEVLRLGAGCIGDEGFRALLDAVQALSRRVFMEIPGNPDGPGKQELEAWLHEAPRSDSKSGI